MTPALPSDRSHLNASVHGKDVTFTLKDGAKVKAQEVRVGVDSIRFTDLDSGARRAVATSRVRTLAVDPERNVGVMIGIGSLFGGFIMAASASTAENLLSGLARFYGGPLLGGIGLATTVVSTHAHQTERYRIDER
jgi:hypothetical protein